MTRMQKWVLLAGLLCAIGTKCAESIKGGFVIHIEVAPLVQEQEPVEETEPVLEYAVVSM